MFKDYEYNCLNVTFGHTCERRNFKIFLEFRSVMVFNPQIFGKIIILNDNVQK